MILTERMTIEAPRRMTFTPAHVEQITTLTADDVTEAIDTSRLHAYTRPGSEEYRIPREYLIMFLAEEALTMNELITTEQQREEFDTDQRKANALSSWGALPKCMRSTDIAQQKANCIAVVSQARRWGMDFFALAGEVYEVHGKIDYQGKVYAAIVNASIAKPLNYKFTGTGDDMEVRCFGTLHGEDEPREVRVTLKQAKTENAMWAHDPEQIICYHAARKWAKRHCPGVVMGITDGSRQINDYQGTPVDQSQVTDAEIREIKAEIVQLETNKQALQDFKAKLSECRKSETAKNFTDAIAMTYPDIADQVKQLGDQRVFDLAKSEPLFEPTEAQPEETVDRMKGYKRELANCRTPEAVGQVMDRYAADYPDWREAIGILGEKRAKELVDETAKQLQAD